MVDIDTDDTELGTVRLRVRGQLDLEATSAFVEALARAARPRRPVEIDLGKVDFIDGSGLSMLIDAQSRALREGHRLTIVSASRYVRRLIEITATADRLPPLQFARQTPQAPARRRITGQAPAAAETTPAESVGTPTFRA